MHLSLRTKILGPVVILIMLIVSVSGVLSYQESAEALEDALVGNMRGEAGALMRAVDSMTGNVVANAERIAQGKELGDFFRRDVYDKELVRQFCEVLQDMLKGYSDFDRISVVDEKGTTVASTATGSIGQNIGDRQYFKTALGGKTNLSQPLLSRATGKGAINAATPLRLDGKIVGIVYCSIPLARFYENSVRPIRVGQNGYAFLVAQNGQIVVHKNPDYLFKDLPTTPYYKEMIAGKEDSGVNEYIGLNGELVYNYFWKNKMLGLVAVIQAESGDVFSSLARIRYTALIVCAVSALVGAVLLFFLLRPVLNTLNASIEFAGRVAAGDLSGTLSSTRKDELGNLAGALCSIPEKLRGVLATADVLAGKIRSGRFRERLDVSNLQGSYAALAASINTVAQSYTDVLDIVPPFMTCDKGRTILFMNESARAVVAQDHSGTKCSGHFNSPECDTANCRGVECMHRQGKVEQETFISPMGGRLDVSAAALPIKDEKGTCVGFYEFFSDVSRIKEIQRAVTKAAEEAAEIADRVASASAELSGNVEEVLRGAKMEQERMGATASAVAKMNSAVFEVAHNASDASGQCEATRDKAETGAQQVDCVIKAISSVNSVAASLQENMHDLGHRAESIGGVMNVISDIADQTNLLALNAAIEAARAGEAGRGFAVVADEVRKLAEKTMTATQEVGHNISGIQHSAKINVVEVEKAVVSIAEATELASGSGRALSEIVQLAAANSAVVASIASAAEEQRATSEEINQSVEEVSGIVNETAAGMDHAAASVQNLAGMAHRLNQVVKNLTAN
ncbi:MAG: methyl-accepting chemotaxis protein [Desulfovibrio sp.]|jgi:methyl-accepting chemotaxis protein|nr:methyl-accepting chemotaxis protein [Desulfovibrio sp.]